MAIVSAFALLLLGIACQASLDFPFYNTSLTWEERVDDLVSRLTLDEMVGQMSKGKGGTDPIARLGIKPFEWWTECLRGDVQQGGTGFPESLGLAAVFNPQVVYNVARATSIEVRAKNTVFSKEGKYDIGMGLSCCSPMINLLRDPRWGRNEETYGEDPYFIGVYSEAFVHGLQGDHPRYLLTNAGCKHFEAYAGPDSYPVTRYEFDAKITTRDIRTTFLPAFRRCIRAKPLNVMCSYNSVNGVPSCANKPLLTGILKDEWGYEGFVISDNRALEYIVTGHHYLNNSIDTAVACIDAGCSVEISSNDDKIYNYIAEAVQKGRIQEARLRELLKPVFYTRMRLGEFDPPEMNPYTKLTLSVVQSPEHRQLSLDAAMMSFVLLKNDNNFLPVKLGQFNKLAILGPAANDTALQNGNYAPAVDPRYTTTPLMNLTRLANSFEYNVGCMDGAKCTRYDKDGVAKALQDSDLVIVCLGLGNDIEMESNDRKDINLPGNQLQLLKDSIDSSPGNTPILLLMFNGGPVDITWADSNPRVVAIMEAFYPSQTTGVALLNVLTMNGPNSVPAARLPNTWPMHDDQTPAITNYTMVGRTYRYLNYDPLYPFGYGLSYTNFTYSNLQFSQSILAGDDVEGTVDVTNSGQFSADEVIQVYISWQDSPEPTPMLQLVNFHRNYVATQNTIRVSFTVSSEDMAVWREDNSGWMIYPGRYNIYVGGQQPNQKRVVGSNILQGTFTVTETKFLGKY